MSFNDNVQSEMPTTGRLFTGFETENVLGYLTVITFKNGEDSVILRAYPARAVVGSTEWIGANTGVRHRRITRSDTQQEFSISGRVNWTGSKVMLPHVRLEGGWHGARRALFTEGGILVASCWNAWKDSDLQKGIKEYFWCDESTLGDYLPGAILILSDVGSALRGDHVDQGLS